MPTLNRQTFEKWKKYELQGLKKRVNPNNKFSCKACIWICMRLCVYLHVCVFSDYVFLENRLFSLCDSSQRAIFMNHITDRDTTCFSTHTCKEIYIKIYESYCGQMFRSGNLLLWGRVHLGKAAAVLHYTLNNCFGSRLKKKKQCWCVLMF